MLNCLLVHTRTEEQSPNMYLLLKVYFFCLSPLVKSSNRASFLKCPTCCVVVVMIWQNNKEFLLKGLLEHASAIHNYVIFVTSIQQCASQS